MSTARPPLDLNDLLASVSPSLARYERGIRILSLDGGGIRGLVLIEQLIALEEAIKPAKISEFFDIICGTSTGGILALAIGLINKSLRDCKELYLNMATKIFGNPRKVPIPSQHDAAILEQVLQQQDNFGQRSLNEFTTSPKVFVVAALTNANNPMAYLFRNYTNSGSNYTGTSNAKLWEAARASSAAPVYFQPFVKGDQCFVDGGIIANNPSFIAIAEARALWPNKEIDTIVSLGTGRSHLPDSTSVGGIIPKLIASGNQLLSSSDNLVAQGASAMLTISQLIIFFKMLIELTTDSEETHNTITTVNLLLKRTINYFRFNPNISFVALDCSDIATLDKMIGETKQYLAQQKSKLRLLADIRTDKNCF